MSKPYSEFEFSEQITGDRTWRLKEISDLRSAIAKSDEGLGRVLLRALVAICYAHWEGYVRFSARKYMEHISLRKYRYKELTPQFLRNYVLPRLASHSIPHSSVSARCELIDEVLAGSERHFTRVNEDLISTKANLNFEVFADICIICSIDVEQFRFHKSFIDVILLKRRNAIAHGENTLVGPDELNEVTERTITLMRAFGDELENQVVLKAYKA